jgi:hypothetical protein
MNSQLLKVTFVRDYSPNQGAGYNGQEEAAFALAEAVKLVALGVAVFSDPADLEANLEAVEAAKRYKPAPFVRRMVPADPHRWG